MDNAGKGAAMDDKTKTGHEKAIELHMRARVMIEVAEEMFRQRTKLMAAAYELERQACEATDDAEGVLLFAGLADQYQRLISEQPSC
jgi:hypothetical protein